MTFALGLICALLWTTAPHAYPQTETEHREIHVEIDPDDGETMVLLRFPLAFAYPQTMADAAGSVPPVTAPFLSHHTTDGAISYHLDQSAYEDDFEGFTAYLLQSYQFEAGGQIIPPMTGALSLVSKKGALMPGYGLAASQSLLDLCAEVPGKNDLNDLEVVMQLYLPDVFPEDAVTITITPPPAPLPVNRAFDTQITDHRLSPPAFEVIQGFAPPVFTLPGRGSGGLLNWLLRRG